MMVVAFVAAIVAAFAASTTTAAAATAAPPTAGSALTVPISFAQSGGLLNGVFTITSFAVNSAGQLVAPSSAASRRR